MITLLSRLLSATTTVINKMIGCKLTGGFIIGSIYLVHYFRLLTLIDKILWNYDSHVLMISFIISVQFGFLIVSKWVMYAFYSWKIIDDCIRVFLRVLIEQLLVNSGFNQLNIVHINANIQKVLQKIPVLKSYVKQQMITLARMIMDGSYWMKIEKKIWLFHFKHPFLLMKYLSMKVLIPVVLLNWKYLNLKDVRHLNF